jgi:AcrR family transcriptional regulator
MTDSRRRDSRSKGSSQKKGRRGYHHGDLAEAMVSAALKLTKEFGPAGFTFAEAARLVGVSPAAPYRHFRDRDALMAFVAERGYEKFTRALAKAWSQGKPDAKTAFKNVGQAYLAFARKEPAYYAAMFEAHLPPDLEREILQASDKAFAILRGAAEALIEEMPVAKRPPAMMMSLHVWALAHGIAVLFGSQSKKSGHAIPMEPEDLLEAGVLVYLEGLGVA